MSPIVLQFEREYCEDCIKPRIIDVALSIALCIALVDDARAQGGLQVEGNQVAIFVMAAAFVIILALVLSSRSRSSSKPKEPVVIAVVIEKSYATGGGIIAGIGMFFVIVLGIAGFLFSNGAVQQAAVAAAATAGAVVCGVGLLIGRHRTYIVQEPVKPEARAEQNPMTWTEQPTDNSQRAEPRL